MSTTEFQAPAMAEEQVRPHALVIFFPMQSHINPTLTLTRRIQALGFTITVLISDSYEASTLAGMGFTVLTYPDPKLDEDNALDFFASEQWSIRKHIEQIAEGLQSVLSCIVFDMASAWISGLASRLHLPSVALVTFPVSTMVLYDNLPLLLSHLSQGVEDGQDKPDFCVPGLIPLAPFDIPTIMRCLEPGPMFDFTLHLIENIYKATWVVMNSFEELEHDALQAMKVRRPNAIEIGPLLPIYYDDGCFTLGPRYWKKDSSCLQWLNMHQDSAVLYISFGGLSRMSIEQVEQLVQGLEASKQPFLWVCRPDFLKSTSYAYLEDLSKRTKHQGLIITWAPQLEVLRHRAVGGHLTHCGWNSIMESVSMGIPMLAWPCRAEQHANSKYILHWGIGVRISNNEIIQKDEICDLIIKLMQGNKAKDMRMRTKDLSVAATTAVKKGGSSYSNLQSIGDALLQCCLKRKV